jgi:hypothetical protein
VESTRTLAIAVLLALCLSLLAACAPEGGPVGVSALPGDPGVYALGADPSVSEPGQHDAGHSLVDCQALQDEDAGCAVRCDTDLH